MLFAQQDGRPLVEFTTAPVFEETGLPLVVMGITVVFMALAFVVSFITVLPRLLARVFPEPQAKQSVAHAADIDELSEETVAVITAAVAATLLQPHRIVRIRGLTPEDQGWSLEGRMQHHQSHRISHRNRP